MNRLLSRVRYVLVSLMFVGTMTATSLTPVFANDHRGGNPNPPGNNGTIKIDGDDITAGHDNDPHVSCSFKVDWFGFNAGSQTANVLFEAQPPTGTATLLSDSTVAFTGSGPGNTLNFTKTYNLTTALSGYVPQAQGHHVKLTVNTTSSQGSDVKHKVFWVSPCVTPPSEVTPLAPGKSTPSCEYPSMLVTPTATTGVLWSPAGSTTLQPGDSVTYTATAAPTYAIKAGVQTSFTVENNFDPETCKQQANPVAPQATTPNCDVRTMTITPVASEGVAWSPVSTTTLLIGQSVTYTASPANNYYFAQGQQTTWQFTNNFNPSSCHCECDNPKEVTAPDVKFRDKCGLENDKFVIPSRVGVTYKVNNEVIVADTYNAHDYDDENHEVVVTAHAASSHYKLIGEKEWSHTFTNEKCKVRADKPMFEDKCEVRNDTFTIPDSQHVYYMVGDVELEAGTYNAHDYDNENHTVVVKAYAKEGYDLKKKDMWSFTYTNLPCGGQGGDNEVTPAVVTFKDLCETVNDTYTIPSTAGVVYKIGGNVVAAGTYNATGTVVVTAEATSGHVLKGTATWSHTFTNVACATTGGGGGGGFVLGDTFTPTPVVAAQPQVLADTGASSVTSTLVAIFVLVTALAVYAFNPKFETR